MLPDDPTRGTSTPTCMLRSNSFMLRDFWWEKGMAKQGDERILCIRQVRFASSTDPEAKVKIIRLPLSEFLEICKSVSEVTLVRKGK